MSYKSWRFGLGDYSKPYVLQQQRDQTTKVSSWTSLLPTVDITHYIQITALEKEIKELRARSTDKETDEPSTLMGSGLGGRLMIGGPG